MLKRLLTSAIGIIVFFAVMFFPTIGFFYGHYAFYLAVIAVNVIILSEIFKMTGADKITKWSGYISSVVILAGIIIKRPLLAANGAAFILLLTVLVTHNKTKSSKVFESAFISVVIPLLLSSIILMRKCTDRYIILLPFVCSWMSDTGAFTFGSLFGRHKLAENISPKKTIEGAVGGLLFSAMGSVVLILVLVECFNRTLPSTMYLYKFAALGLISSVFAQLGDLVASCMKRDYNIKDFGGILPGHGGLMDRFDSVLLCAPVVFYLYIHLI